MAAILHVPHIDSTFFFLSNGRITSIPLILLVPYLYLYPLSSTFLFHFFLHRIVSKCKTELEKRIECGTLISSYILTNNDYNKWFLHHDSSPLQSLLPPLSPLLQLLVWGNSILIDATEKRAAKDREFRQREAKIWRKVNPLMLDYILFTA